jgi:tRNA-dihydrouridine synthase
MNYYFAPMEGVTTHMFRRAHSRLFPGCRKYFSPFIVACQDVGLRGREVRDVLPEVCGGYVLVPQLLSNDAAAFIIAARQLRDLGYGEINLNLGCPSGTVTAKKRGSGFLTVPDELDAFLEAVYSGAAGPISIKTRVGYESAEEFHRLLGVFNKYPVSELTVHPRVRSDFYNGTPDAAAFELAVGNSANPLCYNGDLFRASDCAALRDAYPALPAAMLGRGAAANPALIRQAQGGLPLNSGELREFHDELLEAYRGEYSGDRNVLHKMKELWYYMSAMFPDSARQMKRIYKAQSCAEYVPAVDALFRESPMDPASGFGGQKNSAGF